MKRGILIPMGLATLAVVTLAGPPAARAAGVVGSGTAASCTDGALKAALAGGGLVTFNCGPDVVTIDISPGAGGSGTKTISEDTTIDGAGLITISGGHSMLVFSVMRGVTFTVQNLTIADGNGGGNYGGGISSKGGTLIVSNSTFSGNTSGGGGYGGGISNQSDGLPGTLTVINSTFSGNSAPGGIGGAISDESDGLPGTLTVIDSTFSGNSAFGGIGGGISNRGGTLIVRNSTFSDNTGGRGGYGGAIASASKIRPIAAGGDGQVLQGTLIVSDSTFSGNSAPEGIGGAISSTQSATLVISNSTFSSNSAYRGGGIFFRDDGDLPNVSARLTVSNSTFSGNSAEGDRGGGILIFPHARGPLVVSNSTFSGNSAVLSGGGIQKGCNAGGCEHEALDAALTVANTIVASNAGGNCGFDTAASIADGGHNLDDGTTCGFSAANGSSNNTNPELDPAGLQDNGGPTQTIALQAGSPAINAGSEAVCAAAPVNNLDQRGFVRPGTAATNCSIGAYEYILPGTSDCCQCPTSCAAPTDGSCGDCDVVFNATCQSGSLCVLHTRTPTPSPTPSLPPTLTPSPTPSPTRTPITPSPTPTLGATDCCQCDTFCAAPIHGTCGGCVVVRGASCTSESLCIARTPAPSSTRPCMGDCSGDGQVTVDELLTMVNMALGTAAAASCPTGLPLGTCLQNRVLACNSDDDCNPFPGGPCTLRNSGRVPGAAIPDDLITIAEILTAVNSALNGCAAG